jgi:hypothetical protein
MNADIQLHQDSSTALESWKEELDQATRSNEENAITSNVPSILRSLVAANHQDSQGAAQEAAQRIDFDYWHVYLPSDPLLLGTEDKGMATFLTQLYELLFSVARLLHYDNTRQEVIVQLLVELRKLAPKHFTIWEVGDSHR